MAYTTSIHTGIQHVTKLMHTSKLLNAQIHANDRPKKVDWQPMAVTSVSSIQICMYDRKHANTQYTQILSTIFLIVEVFFINYLFLKFVFVFIINVSHASSIILSLSNVTWDFFLCKGCTVCNVSLELPFWIG